LDEKDDIIFKSDKGNLRKSASAVGIFFILFNLFIIVAEIIMVLGFYFIMKSEFPTNKYEFKETFKFFYTFSKTTENMSIIANFIVQFLSLTMSLGVVALIFRFNPIKMIFSKPSRINQPEESTFLIENLENIENHSKKTGGKLIMILFPILIFINLITSIIINKIISAIERSGIKVPEVDFDFHNLKPSTLVIYFLALCIFAPIIEEIICRGFVIKLLKPFGNKFAIFVSALIFGLLHGNMGQGFGAFFVGLLLGIVAVKTGSIIPTIILHSLNNLLPFLATVVDNMPNKDSLSTILGLVYLALFILGIVNLIRFHNIFKVENNNTSVLLSTKIYLTFFLNIFVLFYILYEIYRFFAQFLTV